MTDSRNKASSYRIFTLVQGPKVKIGFLETTLSGTRPEDKVGVRMSGTMPKSRKRMILVQCPRIEIGTYLFEF